MDLERLRQHELEVLREIKGLLGASSDPDAGYVIAAGLRNSYPDTEVYVVVRRFRSRSQLLFDKNQHVDLGKSFPLWGEDDVHAADVCGDLGIATGELLDTGDARTFNWGSEEVTWL